MPQILKNLLSFRLLYVLLGGFFFYLVSITFDLVFIPRLEMTQPWCNKWVERKIGYRTTKECVEFPDKLKELKYRHNQKMEERFTYKMFGTFLFATMLTFFMMLLNPHKFFDRNITLENCTEAIAVAVFYGVIIGFLLPVVFQMLLPPPSDWLPNEFFEIQKARKEMILRELSRQITQKN